MVQFSEEAEPDYRHAEIDLFSTTAVHGQGLGTEKAGFRSIGRAGKSWLGPDGAWHDEVLMELVVDPASVAGPANGGQ